MVSGEEDLIMPFFDVRVFNPYAQSNRQQNLTSTYRKHENIKKRAYEQRVREIEFGSFTLPPCVVAHWSPRKSSHCELQKTCLNDSFTERPDLQCHYGLVKMPTIFLSIVI